VERFQAGRETAGNPVVRLRCEKFLLANPEVVAVLLKSSDLSWQSWREALPVFTETWLRRHWRELARLPAAGISLPLWLAVPWNLWRGAGDGCFAVPVSGRLRPCRTYRHRRWNRYSRCCCPPGDSATGSAPTAEPATAENRAPERSDPEQGKRRDKLAAAE